MQGEEWRLIEAFAEADDGSHEVRSLKQSGDRVEICLKVPKKACLRPLRLAFYTKSSLRLLETAALNRTYNDAGAHDKTTEVREKVDQLKGIMQDNVKKILETHVTLESLESLALRGYVL